MTLPDLSALGLETSETDCAVIKRKASSDIVRYVETEQPRSEPGRRLALLRDRTRLITALSEARGREADNEDMAAVGRSLMESLAINRKHSFLKNWSPADDPAEVLVDLLNELDACEAAAREEERQKCASVIATLTAENAELTRRAADAYMLARQPAPEPVDTGGNDDTMATLRRGLS